MSPTKKNEKSATVLENSSDIDFNSLKNADGKLSIFEDFVPMSNFKYYLTGFVSMMKKLGLWLGSLCVDVGRAFLNLFVGLAKIIVGIFVGIYKFFTVKIFRYFKEDDAFGRLSYIFMGTSSLANRQFVNGFLYIGFEILFIVYMVLQGGFDLYLLSGPGLTGPTDIENPVTGIIQTIPGDNSIQCLILGIIAVIFVLLFIYVWYRNINAAHNNSIVRKGNKYFDGYKAVKELLKDENLDTFANVTKVKANGKVKRRFCLSVDSYLKKQVGLSKEASSLICYSDFAKLFRDYPSLYKAYFINSGLKGSQKPTKDFYKDYLAYKDHVFDYFEAKESLGDINFADYLTFKVNIKHDKKSSLLKIRSYSKVDSSIGETLFNVYCDFLKYYEKELFYKEKTNLIKSTLLVGVEDFYKTISSSFAEKITIENYKDILQFLRFEKNSLKFVNLNTTILKLESDYALTREEAKEAALSFVNYIKYREEVFLNNDRYNDLLMSNVEVNFKSFYKKYLLKNNLAIPLFNVENDLVNVLNIFLNNDLNDKTQIVNAIFKYYGISSEDIGLDDKYFKVANELVSILQNQTYNLNSSKNIVEEFNKQTKNLIASRIETYKSLYPDVKWTEELILNLLVCFDIDDVKYKVNAVKGIYTPTFDKADKETYILSSLKNKAVYNGLKELVNRLNANPSLDVEDEFYEAYVDKLSKSKDYLKSNKDKFVNDFAIEEKNFHFAFDKYNIYQTYLDFNNAFLNVARNSRELVNCFYNLDSKNVDYNRNTKFLTNDEKLALYNEKVNKIHERYHEIFDIKANILKDIQNRRIKCNQDLAELKASYLAKVEEFKAEGAPAYKIVNEKEFFIEKCNQIKEQMTLDVNKLDGQYNGMQADKLIKSMYKEELQQAKSAYQRSVKINKAVETYIFGKELGLRAVESNIISNFTCSNQIAKAVAKSYKKAINIVKNIKSVYLKIHESKSDEEIAEIIAKNMKIEVNFDLSRLLSEDIPYEVISSIVSQKIIARTENRISDFTARYGDVQYCGQCKPFKKTVNSLLTDQFHSVILFLPVLGALIVTIIPLFSSLLIAFTNFDGAHTNPELFNWVGLNNFIGMFTGESAIFGSGIAGVERIPYTIGYLLLWTLIWAFFATFTNYFLGIILSLVINKKSIKFKKVFRTVFVLTIAIPQFISLLCVANLFGQYGPINMFISNAGGAKIPFLTEEYMAKFMIIVINCWVGVPYTMLMATGILMNIPTDLYESSRIDGAGPTTQFFKITMPYMFFITGPSLITSFVSNINNFNVIFFLTGEATQDTRLYQAKSTDLLINWLYTLTTGVSHSYNISASLGIIIFVICAFFSLVMYSRLGAVQREDQFQ